MKFLLNRCFLATIVHTTYWQQKSVGVFEEKNDRGAVLHPGSTRYKAAGQTCELTGSGKNIRSGQDEIYFAWERIAFVSHTDVSVISRADVAGK